MKQLVITTSTTQRDSAALNAYLAEVNRKPMITAAEEVDLAIRIQNGDQRALDQLVEANLRFVVSVAKKYQYIGLSLVDLINEGNIGLIKAAQKFDHTKGFKFISYAVWWVRQSILDALAKKGRVVRVPSNQGAMPDCKTRFDADAPRAESHAMPAFCDPIGPRIRVSADP